jgi:hypothetical protein
LDRLVRTKIFRRSELRMGGAANGADVGKGRVPAEID